MNTRIRPWGICLGAALVLSGCHGFTYYVQDSDVPVAFSPVSTENAGSITPFEEERRHFFLLSGLVRLNDAKIDEILKKYESSPRAQVSQIEIQQQISGTDVAIVFGEIVVWSIGSMVAQLTNPTFAAAAKDPVVGVALNQAPGALFLIPWTVTYKGVIVEPKKGAAK